MTNIDLMRKNLRNLMEKSFTSLTSPVFHNVHRERKILKLTRFDNSLSLSHLPSDDLVKLCLPPGTAATSSLQLEASSSPRRSPLPIARSPPSRPTHRADRRQRPLSKLSSTSSKPRPRARPPPPHTDCKKKKKKGWLAPLSMEGWCIHHLLHFSI